MYPRPKLPYKKPKKGDDIFRIQQRKDGEDVFLCFDGEWRNESDADWHLIFASPDDAEHYLFNYKLVQPLDEEPEGAFLIKL